MERQRNDHVSVDSTWRTHKNPWTTVASGKGMGNLGVFPLLPLKHWTVSRMHRSIFKSSFSAPMPSPARCIHLWGQLEADSLEKLQEVSRGTHKVSWSETYSSGWIKFTGSLESVGSSGFYTKKNQSGMWVKLSLWSPGVHMAAPSPVHQWPENLLAEVTAEMPTSLVLTNMPLHPRHAQSLRTA